ncbi:unnamed protein product [Allacma fusca]|uniref:Uncharacterized protein n=1 Tax=Allacma fusca TaxID=39272 RepID=A0A8J2JXD8_9HEXA|nr:unnamed protein product [Allacma fusca]
MVSFTDTNEKEGTDMSSGIYTRSKARVSRAPLRASSGTERSTSSNIERPRRSQACCSGSKINIYVGNVITNQYLSGSTEMEPGAQPEENLINGAVDNWTTNRGLIVAVIVKGV